MDGLVLLKLGGSLITDKTRPYTPLPAVIRRLSEEISQALQASPELRLLLGHGSGSFGHQAASVYHTRQGVQTAAEWRGYAQVAAAAARLNRLVTDNLLEAGVPVVSLQPSASARCRDGRLVYLDTAPISRALAHGLTPLLYGDVSLDETRGGTIISTEDIFVYLAEHLTPQRVVLAGQTPGVLDGNGEVIPLITPAGLAEVRAALSGSHGVDVTGGMADKVAQMAALVERYPGLSVQVISGTTPGLVRRALLEQHTVSGTVIAS